MPGENTDFPINNFPPQPWPPGALTGEDELRRTEENDRLVEEFVKAQEDRDAQRIVDQLAEAVSTVAQKIAKDDRPLHGGFIGLTTCPRCGHQS
jgi:hypothetical protein